MKGKKERGRIDSEKEGGKQGGMRMKGHGTMEKEEEEEN